MAQYRLLKHKDYEISAERLPPSTRRKALWAQVLLGTRGRTPSVKGTTGLNAHWRRTPVQGNHYYMWWIPRSEVRLDTNGYGNGTHDDPNAPRQDQTILVHSIRHHDETDDPIDFGALTDYEEVAIGSLDPRYAEQTAVSTQVQQAYLALATVMGLPGSGKTISLLYLARDLAKRGDLQHILYITYTNRLKRAAQEFLQAQGEELASKVRVATLGEIEAQLTKLSSYHEPFGDLTRFENFVKTQSNSVLGPWRRYPQTLYTEIRAHLLGKTFPTAYPLPTSRAKELIPFQDGFNGKAYAKSRGLEIETAELACRLAERAQSAHFFQDQQAAFQAIQRLLKGRSPGWLAELDALVIDEVQDLTLVQIAMLGTMVQERRRRRADAPFAFVVAGDESQIVQPSGFDWGVTKDVLSDHLGLHPQDFEFSYQRRSPRNLAQLIDHSWELYTNLPKQLRPSGRRRAFLYDTVGQNATDEGNGEIFLCAPMELPDPQQRQPDNNWQALLDELTAKPGRVIVDLSEELKNALSVHLPTDEESKQQRSEAIFLPREIKGLERTTVILYGLNALYAHAMDLCHRDNYSDTIPRFEARRLFDEIRVALSRSTDRLVILEATDAPILEALNLEEIPNVRPIRWNTLIETLQTEELSALEVIQGYLEEVDDFFERGMWEQGYRRNRRAHELALLEEDEALRREAEEQYITGHVSEAAALIADQQWQPAFKVNQRAATLARKYGYPEFIDDVELQTSELVGAIAVEVEQRLAKAFDQIIQNR
ncbi:MAG: AAA family ATPase, partial [Caldilineaceae bacterium]|nr:AAA family ATPase [Caldilineaceae bacterium]